MVWTPAPPRATIVSMFYGECLNKASPMTPRTAPMTQGLGRLRRLEGAIGSIWFAPLRLLHHGAGRAAVPLPRKRTGEDFI